MNKWSHGEKNMELNNTDEREKEEKDRDLI